MIHLLTFDAFQEDWDGLSYEDYWKEVKISLNQVTGEINVTHAPNKTVDFIELNFEVTPTGVIFK